MLELVRVRLERKTRRILDTANLAVHSGEVHGILGQIGTGKSHPGVCHHGASRIPAGLRDRAFDKKGRNEPAPCHRALQERLFPQSAIATAILR